MVAVYCIECKKLLDKLEVEAYEATGERYCDKCIFNNIREIDLIESVDEED